MTLAAAGVLFSVQFLFTKQYQLRAGRRLAARPIWMLVFANLWMGFLFLSAGGFRLRILPASLLYAVVYAVCAAVNNSASLFAMRLGKVAVVTLFSLSGGLLLPSAYGVIRLGEPLTAGKAAGTLLIVLASFGCLFGKQDERAGRGLPAALLAPVFRGVRFQRHGQRGDESCTPFARIRIPAGSF